jgi:hypothetical protein
MFEAYNYPILNLANRKIIFYNFIIKKKYPGKRPKIVRGSGRIILMIVMMIDDNENIMDDDVEDDDIEGDEVHDNDIEDKDEDNAEDEMENNKFENNIEKEKDYDINNNIEAEDEKDYIIIMED